MTTDLATLNDMLKNLAEYDKSAPLVFVTPEGKISGGYHVTELKQGAITSIDCGGNVDDWHETTVQLLDGRSGEHMSVGKFSAIATKSLNILSALGEAQLFLEFALNNEGLRRYEIQSVSQQNGQVHTYLKEVHALCKPALNFTGKSNRSDKGSSADCCSGSETVSACCA